MGNRIDNEIAKLRTLVEMYEEGVLVVDVLNEGDARPSFRTLVQVDGDVMSSIDPAAIGHPKFDEAHARHIEHVSERLRALTDGPRRWSMRFSTVLSGVWTGLIAIGSQGSGWATAVAGETWDEVFSVASGFAMGVIVWPMGKMLLKQVISLAMEAERNSKTQSVIARLTGQSN